MATPIELLSPAKDLECGVAAINHGADAVYIGAPQFSARVNAGNSLSDIEKLCHYAHLYHAHVHIALNTILTDEELELARQLVFRLYEAGADALIIQDVGLLQLDLPPIAIHASTQTDNRTVEKVRFWEECGLQRAILARELSLEEIREIRRQTSIELEAFVHGALCVSYSGQCYMSEACAGRSANRGACAQFCRLPYDLTDAQGKVIRKHSHLLSLKDMNRSSSIAELIDAGITSLKIEGRLKNIDYVKNITAHYRLLLDQLMGSDSRYTHASSGKVALAFTPNPTKTFNRGSTDYFLHGRTPTRVNPDTPKSIGEPVGMILSAKGNTLEINTSIPLHNGDGLGFIDTQGELCGFRVNKVENQKITTLEPLQNLKPGTLLYRNYDIEFDRRIQGESAVRRILTDILFTDTPDGFSLTFTDEDGCSVTRTFPSEKQSSRKGEAILESLKRSLSKLGETQFEARQVVIRTTEPYFIPNSVLNEWRRETATLLEEKRRECHVRPSRKGHDHPDFKFPCPTGDTLTYLGNVLNTRAVQFYKQHGIRQVLPAFEKEPVKDAVVMRCKHCIRYTLGYCSREGKRLPFEEPLYLQNGTNKFRLDFDCVRCEMTVTR